jgi:hypothetical protein
MKSIKEIREMLENGRYDKHGDLYATETIKQLCDRIEELQKRPCLAFVGSADPDADTTACLICGHDISKYEKYFEIMMKKRDTQIKALQDLIEMIPQDYRNYEEMASGRLCDEYTARAKKLGCFKDKSTAHHPL